MARITHHRTLVIPALLALILLVSACSAPAEKLNNDGNEKYAQEAYMEALAAYQSAQIESPELAEPYYNAANSLYREGAYEEALAQMQQALQFANADQLAQNGFYNQGNASFNMEEWQAAVDAYAQALLRNPDDLDAKYNLELALQQLQQQQQEQQQQEQQDQQDNQEQQQDQSQDGESQQDEQQQGQSQDGQDQQQDQPQDGQGQPQESEGQPQQPGQTPAPGQRMTADQARQLLAATAQDSETLQERLKQMFVVPPLPPVQDW